MPYLKLFHIFRILIVKLKYTGHLWYLIQPIADSNNQAFVTEAAVTFLRHLLL